MIFAKCRPPNHRLAIFGRAERRDETLRRPHTSTHAGRHAALTPPRLSSPRHRALSARRPRLVRPRRWRQPPTLAAVPAVTRRHASQLAAASSTATRRRVFTATLAASASPASSPPTPLSSRRLSRCRALCTCRRASRHPAAAPLATPPPRLHWPPPLCTSRPSLYATLFSHGFVSFVLSVRYSTGCTGSSCCVNDGVGYQVSSHSAPL